MQSIHALLVLYITLSYNVYNILSFHTTSTTIYRNKQSNLLMNIGSNIEKFMQSFNIPNNNKNDSNKNKSIKVNRIAISGSTGLIGSELIKKFKNDNIEIIPITTKNKIKDNENVVTWDLESNIIDNIELLEDVDVLIHLAGESVADIWTDKKKANIYNSRITSTLLLVNTMKNLKKKPKCFISASGLGYYGYTSTDTVYNDTMDVPEEGFLSKVTHDWEKEAFKAQSLYGVRTVSLRLAPIFSSKGGILAKLLPIFYLNAGGILGDGKQPFNWISINDVVNVIDYIIKNKKLVGPINVCSPVSITNSQFTSSFSRAINRISIFPVPSFIINFIFGEMGQEMLLGGRKCIPKKLLDSGYIFEDTDIEVTIKDLLTNKQ